MENIPEALKLLAVGMLTVFAILLIVIYLGKALIAIINKFVPEENKDKKTPALAGITVDATTKSVISEVVNRLTGGKGHVDKITKI